MSRITVGQLRDGEEGGLYLVLESTVTGGYPCWRCLILVMDADFPQQAVGTLEDIPAQWIRNYTKQVG